MKWLLYSLFCFYSILPAAAQQADTTVITNTIPIEKESYNVEMAIQVKPDYTAYSFSIEKEFHNNNFYFGPRIEIENPFRPQPYRVQEMGKDTVHYYNLLINIRLVQIEYQLNPQLRVGIAPFWMQGPLPRKGWYKTPTSLYAQFWLDKPKSLQLIAQFNTHLPNPAQIELRKRF